jgi:hypothetical protein
MITVFQCGSCNTIVGDTDIPLTSVSDGVHEVRFACMVDIARGRVKCETCKETLGTQDQQSKIFYNTKAVKKYTVRSSSETDPKRRKKDPQASTGTDTQDQYLEKQVFEKYEERIDKELGDIKETILSLFEAIKGQ